MTQQHQTENEGVVWEVPGHHWQEEERVREYVEHTTQHADSRVNVFNQMADLFPFERDAAIRVLDIGSGYGAVAAAVLDRFPNATAVGLDISVPMMEVGRERMARFGKRFSYHIGDFAEGGLPADVGKFDAAVASASIHHLPSEAKRRLYREIFQHLNDVGCFFNVDQVVPEDEEAKLFYRALRDLDRANRPVVPAEPSAHTVMTHHHIETTNDQVAWLKEAGFQGADCFYKNLQQTIIGGYKGATAQDRAAVVAKRTSRAI